MTEVGGGRTADEREAARLEREAARLERERLEAEEEAPEEEADDELPSGTRRVSRRHRLGMVEHRPPRNGSPARAKTPRPRRRAGRIVSILALVVGAAVIWFLVELFQPFQGSGHGSITVTIPAKTSSRQIGDMLARDGVVSSGFFFEVRAYLAGEQGDLRPGTYHLKLGMSYGDVLKVLTTPPPAAKTTNVTLIEGLTIRQVDALLRSQHVAGSYLATVRRTKLLRPQQFGAPRNTASLEGFMFPNTYQLREPVAVSALVADQLRAFRQQFARVNLSYARKKHLTPYDVLIVASIVQREAGTLHDFPLVASVIYNRLAQHMPLGMDSTTRYEFNDYNKPLTQSQLAARSPYNTRLNVGLPPTPIDNPGLPAIRAAANPARTNYLYFVVKPGGNGASVFTSSFQQFLTFERDYQLARARRGGRSPTSH